MSYFDFSPEFILDKVRTIDPKKYAATRNYHKGHITQLSPYISRGMLSTVDVVKSLISQGYSFDDSEKLVSELAWRDYWQSQWKVMGEAINKDIKHAPPRACHRETPTALLNGQTGIKVIDAAIFELQETGYLHNHMRMYISSIACHFGRSHWENPARWMYYHLMDGDWASNAMSWQWVSGASRNKTYFFNQENLNKYWESLQTGTFIDDSYEVLENLETPEVLGKTQKTQWKTELPTSGELEPDLEKPVIVYTTYNLDPHWMKDVDAHRIFLWEPSHFDQYPISNKVVKGMLSAAEHIPKHTLYVGEFKELMSHFSGEIHYKNHPFTQHFVGRGHTFERLYVSEKNHKSFFSFWKEALPQIKSMWD